MEQGGRLDVRSVTRSPEGGLACFYQPLSQFCCFLVERVVRHYRQLWHFFAADFLKFRYSYNAADEGATSTSVENGLRADVERRRWARRGQQVAFSVLDKIKNNCS
jgi:hypothetical protein